MTLVKENLDLQKIGDQDGISLTSFLFLFIQLKNRAFVLQEGSDVIMPVMIKRAYEKPTKDDGVRVLVDRMWPRGLSKEKLKIDHWVKEVAPSNDLRKWFDHDEEKFQEFKKRYKKELEDHKETKEALEELKKLTVKEKKHLTLVYGAKDEKHNQAVVLKEILDHQHI